MNIGFIGLGHLGTPIAMNLLEQTGHLYVYNRTAAKMKALLERGATACSSVKELASHCDLVFTLVSDDAAFKCNHFERRWNCCEFKTGWHSCFHQHYFS